MAPALVTVRAATLDDVDVLADVGASSFRAAYTPHSDRADLESHLGEFFTADAIRAELARQRSSYLLASVAGEPGGIAKYRCAACPAPGGVSDALELQQLYVLADKQRHGVGRCLVEAVQQIARLQQRPGIWLSAWEDADWALTFYRKQGFVIVGKAEFTLGSTNYTDHLMWLPVSQAGQKT